MAIQKYFFKYVVIEKMVVYIVLNEPNFGPFIKNGPLLQIVFAAVNQTAPKRYHLFSILCTPSVPNYKSFQESWRVKPF